MLQTYCLFEILAVCGVLFQFHNCMLVLENQVLGLFGWVFFKSAVFTFKGEKLKNMIFFFTVSKIFLSLLF